jgi:hypothetical protein
MASCACRQGRDGGRSRGAAGFDCRLQWTGGRCGRLRWFLHQPCGVAPSRSALIARTRGRHGTAGGDSKRAPRNASFRGFTSVAHGSVANGRLPASPQVWQDAKQSSLRPLGVGCGHPQQSQSPLAPLCACMSSALTAVLSRRSSTEVAVQVTASQTPTPAGQPHNRMRAHTPKQSRKPATPHSPEDYSGRPCMRMMAPPCRDDAHAVPPHAHACACARVSCASCVVYGTYVRGVRLPL